MFDHLLQGKKIDNNLHHYQSLPGIIENAKNDEQLTLNISSPLSESQWYCLFYEAKKHGLKSLNLRLAGGVVLPEELEISEVESVFSATVLDENVALCSVLLSNAPNELCRTILQSDTALTPLILDIEDYSYQDLFYQETFDSSADGYGFTNFKCIKSELLVALEEGRSVILKGQFSARMLHYLHPILATGYVEQSGQPRVILKGKLTLIVDTPELTENTTETEKQSIIQERHLSWLPNTQCVYQKAMPNVSQVLVETLLSVILSELMFENLSEVNADTFLNERQKLLLDNVAGHPENSLILLTGDTGVGKSSLMKSLSHVSGNTVYYGFDAIQAWADDKSDRVKFLFMDEHNLLNAHLTVFAPLSLESPTKTILYQGKLLTLDQHHKFVAAGNDLNYEGGRVKQLLWEKYPALEIKLQDFHPAYIYQNLLLPLYKKADEKIKIRLTEVAFQAHCVALLKQYGIDKDATHVMTVRALQEATLNYLATNIETSTPLIDKQKNAIHYTEEQKVVHRTLKNKIHLHELQCQSLLPIGGLGLNGVLLIGESGVGKSTLVENALAGLEENRDYLKIDASLPLNIQKAIILRGFNQGLILWIDEVNSLLNTDLERYINAVLTGENPETGESAPAGVPPCVMIMTGNKADREGRAEISPAIIARCIQHEIKNTYNFRKPLSNVEQLSLKIREEIARHIYLTDITVENLLKLSQENLALFWEAFIFCETSKESTMAANLKIASDFLKALFSSQDQTFLKFIGMRNANGNTVFHELVTKECNLTREIFNLLITTTVTLESLVEVLQVQNNEGNTVFHVLAKQDYPYSYEKVFDALKSNQKSAEIAKFWKIQNNEGNGILHLFLKNKNIDKLKDLFTYSLSKKVIMDVLMLKNNEGKTPLHIFFENSPSDNLTLCTNELIQYLSATDVWDILNVKDNEQKNVLDYLSPDKKASLLIHLNSKAKSAQSYFKNEATNIFYTKASLEQNQSSIKISKNELKSILDQYESYARNRGRWFSWKLDGSTTIKKLKKLLLSKEENEGVSLEEIKKAIHRTTIDFSPNHKKSGTDFVLTEIRNKFDEKFDLPSITPKH